ncbi:NAD(P)/FAD-dependent oxidoreductase, partial [Acinetobacter sp. 207]
MQDAAAYYQVAIIGAGFGGLAMAIRLLQRNIHNFVILEKSDEVGGTWRENQYPGAACDVQSHLYSLSFAPKTDWSKRYAEAPEIFQYIQDVVQQFNLREYCQFNSEVVHTEYHEKDCVWHVALKDGRQLSCQYLVFASGPLHVPQIPHIKG